MKVEEAASQVPILTPVQVIVLAGTSRTISFPNEFFGKCVSLLLTNLDAAAVATYQIDGSSRAIISLAADGFRAIDDTKISLLTIVAGAGGNCQVEAQVQLLKDR